MKSELLAPAGSIDALHAALSAGADAVYIGGDRFGARAYADNPGEAELCEAIRLTHRLDKKLYMTVNTLLKDRELEKELYDWMKPYVLEGLDGVIVQDFGVVDFFRRVFPELPLHASTQMAVTGIHSARMMQRLGFERIVPARELTLSEIQAIYEDTGIEIEAFAHGAMCYSYSGMCLMSSMIGGRSGNRGRCAGVCRLPFSVFDAESKQVNGRNTGYPLNMKDMCTLHILPQMMRAGILSYKIEGRMKKPEYTAGVVAVYRKYMDLAMQDPTNYTVDPEDERFLWELFNRDGFNDGCYLERNGRSLIALQNEKLTDIRRDSAKELTERIRRDLNAKESRRKLQAGLTGCVTIRKGEPIRVAVDWMDRAHALSEVGQAEQAQRQPLTEERVAAQMNKTGNDPFYFIDLKIDLEPDCFVPVQMLNEARREAFQLLIRNINALFTRKEIADLAEKRSLEAANTASGKIAAENAETGNNETELWVEVLTEEQLAATVRESRICGIYADHALLHHESSREQITAAAQSGREVRLMLPHILRENGEHYVRTAIQSYLQLPGSRKGILVRALEELGLLHELHLDHLVILDASIYTMNTRAELFWEQNGYRKNTVSLELNAGELSERSNTSSEMIVYGRAPMMVAAHCLQKTLRSCNHRSEKLTMVDRKNAHFPVHCFCNTCYNVIYNAVPLSLLREKEKLHAQGCRVYRISLTTEDGKTAGQVIKAFADVYVSGKSAELPFETTRGHFRRGVL